MAGDVWALRVFQRAYRLSLDLHRASLGWPRVEQYGGVADQLRRSSKSICALLVEGGGRQPGSDAEFRRYVVMAIGSADEARLWCCYAADLDLAPPRDRAGVADRDHRNRSHATRPARSLV
jgi:four helix bundle protein